MMVIIIMVMVFMMMVVTMVVRMVKRWQQEISKQESISVLHIRAK